MTAMFSSSAAFSAEELLRDAPKAEDDVQALGGSQEANAALLKLMTVMGGLDRRPPVSAVVLGGVVRFVEATVLAGVGAATTMAAEDGSRLLVGTVTAAAAVATVIVWKAMRVHGVRSLREAKGALTRLLAGFAAVTFVALAGATLCGVAHAALPLAVWFGAAGAGLIALRTAAARYVGTLTQEGRLERRAVVVGGGKPGQDLLDSMSQAPDPDLRILGVFDDRNDTRSPTMLGGYPKLGTVSDLVAFARQTRIDLIIFTLPITAEGRLLQMLKKLWVLPTDIRLAAHRSGLRFRPQSYSYVGGVPVLDMFDKPIADWDVVIKAIFDRVVGAVAIVALSPVLLLTALAIKLDSRGPVFFKQMRHGFNNEPVAVLKFRSLYADQSDFNAARQVTKDDPRVTKVGRFIRKTSIDELPQLFNVVFKGNLSLVGPRPHALHAQLANKDYNDVVDGYFARHRVKPGITGWAQVNGWRGETDTPVKIQKRVEHDLAYIENWSIAFDLYILALTPLALTRTENAY